MAFRKPRTVYLGYIAQPAGGKAYFVLEPSGRKIHFERSTSGVLKFPVDAAYTTVKTLAEARKLAMRHYAATHSATEVKLAELGEKIGNMKKPSKDVRPEELRKAIMKDAYRKAGAAAKRRTRNA